MPQSLRLYTHSRRPMTRVPGRAGPGRTQGGARHGLHDGPAGCALRPAHLARPAGGRAGGGSAAVSDRRRMLGLSYSSMDMPRDSRRLPSDSPSPDELEKVRCRSTPGMATEVSRPSPLQNSRMLCATLDGCGQGGNGTDSVSSGPAITESGRGRLRLPRRSERRRPAPP